MTRYFKPRYDTSYAYVAVTEDSATDYFKNGAIRTFITDHPAQLGYATIMEFYEERLIEITKAEAFQLKDGYHY